MHRTLTAALPLSIAALAMLAAACGSTSPTTPTPTALTWRLTGTVQSVTAGTIAAATVTVVDGPAAGRETLTDANGRYSFASLPQAGFNVRAVAPGFVAFAQGVNLTADTTVDFQLAREPVAVLTFEGDLVFTPRPDGAFDLTAAGVNTGSTACAFAINGTSTITASNGFTLNYTWSMPPGFVARPGDRFIYTMGVISRNDVIQLGQTGSYFTRATFSSNACP
jgi:hypothetical protein